MKKTYNTPICEVIVIKGEDVITTSFDGEEIAFIGGNQIDLGEIQFN